MPCRNVHAHAEKDAENSNWVNLDVKFTWQFRCIYSRLPEDPEDTLFDE